MAQFRQPDFSRGDPNTLGGYMAVHDRPAAFEGSDGFSYSVEILTDRDEASDTWGAYLFFVKWARIGASNPEGHLESEILTHAATEAAAWERAGALPLSEVKRILDALIARASGGRPARKWWDAMAAEDGEGEGGGPEQ
jgi:hypothetical protein